MRSEEGEKKNPEREKKAKEEEKQPYLVRRLDVDRDQVVDQLVVDRVVVLCVVVRQPNIVHQNRDVEVSDDAGDAGVVCRRRGAEIDGDDFRVDLVLGLDLRGRGGELGLGAGEEGDVEACFGGVLVVVELEDRGGRG